MRVLCLFGARWFRPRVAAAVVSVRGALLLPYLRRQVVRTAQRMARLGLVRGSSGNVSLRMGERILITASATPYMGLTAKQVIEIDYEGERYSGSGSPSSEWRMHAAIYRARKDIQAIVHTHSLFATAAAICLTELPMENDEGEFLFGDTIPVAKHKPAGSWELADAAVDALSDGKAVLLARHGAVALGSRLEEALHLAEKVEEMAQLSFMSRQMRDSVAGN